MSDTATEEKVEDQTEKETNELGAEEEISEETIKGADEITSLLEDDDEKDTEEDDDTGADDKDTEGKEGDDKETSEKTEDDEKTKTDDNAGQEEKKDAEIDDSLLQRAVDAGMLITQARSFKSKDDLETSVAFAESQKASHAEVKTVSDNKAADEKKDEEEVKIERVNLDELLGKDYDEDLVKPLNEAFGKMSDQIEQLTKDFKSEKDENAQLKSSVDSRETDRAINDFDERIGKLPDEFKDVFGEGNFDSLKDTSKEYGQRSKVLNEMGIMVEGYKASNQAAPPIQTLLERAVYNVTGKTVTAKQTEKKLDEKDQKTKDELAKRAKGSIGKPTGGKVKDQTNAGKAIHAANEIARLMDG